MTNDSNKKDTQGSNFREQILRDLERLREERLAAQHNSEEPTQEILTEELSDEAVVEKTELPEEVRLDHQTNLDVIEIEEPMAADTNSEVAENVEQISVSEVYPDELVVDYFPINHQGDELETEIPSMQEKSDLDATVIHGQPTVTSTLEDDVEEVEKEDMAETQAMPILTKSQEKEGVEETPAEHHKMSRKSKKSHRKQQERVAKRIVTAVVVIVLLAIGATGVAGYSYFKSSLEPINAQSSKYVQVEIPSGSTTMQIGQILFEKNLIKNPTIFNYYSKLKSYNNFQSGFYNLNQNMSLDELAKALQEPGAVAPQEPVAGKVLVVEGYTLEQIAKAVTDNVQTETKDDVTPFTAEAFLETVNNPDFINRMVAAYPNLFASLPTADSGVKYQLEGYLFPATYEYYENSTMEDLIEQMIAAMDARLQPYYDQLAGKGLDVNSLLTLASLVEKEGSTDEDRRNIASVFYNRLNVGMPLQSNIAVLYAMGQLGEKTTLAEDAAIDTTIDSPYNIYANTGLMPGPVDTPSLSAIEATLNPNQTDYYYFVADVTTGTVYFATTIEEHDKNVATYVNGNINQE